MTRTALILPATLLLLLATARCSAPASGVGDEALSGSNDSGIPTLTGSSATASPVACNSPGPDLFGNALCLCGDFNDVGNFTVSGGSGDNLGSVGVNGISKVINNTHVAGSWASAGAVTAIGNFEVLTNAYAESDLTVLGNLQVTGDLSVGGALGGIGRLSVGGALAQAGTGSVLGFQMAGSVGSYTAPSGPPCGCTGSAVFDVAGAITAAQAQNDNGSQGVDVGALAGIGYSNLTLTGGSYFFDGSKGIGLSKITISGPVAMYVNGSLDEIGADLFDIAPNATLDLYVSGGVNTVGYAQTGDGARADAFRLYVAGTNTISVSVGAQMFYGSIYAPAATISYVGDTIIEGSLFANTLSGVGNLQLTGSRPLQPSGCGNSGDAPPYTTKQIP